MNGDEEQIPLSTKIKAKLFGDATQRKLTAAIQTTGEIIGRKKVDFRDTAAELVVKANRIRAQKMGAPGNVLLDITLLGQWLIDHNQQPNIGVKEAMKIIHDEQERN